MCHDVDSPALFNYPSYVPTEMAKILKVASGDDTGNSESIKEFVVDKINHWSQLLKKKQILQGKLDKAKDKKILQSQFRELDKEYCNIGRDLKKALQGRIVHTLDYDSNIYEIVEYNNAENYIKARMIYDQNRILIAEESYQNIKIFYPQDIENKLKFLTIKEEAGIRIEMLKDYHIFKIYYQIDESMGEKMWLPMSIEPQCLHMNEYDNIFGFVFRTTKIKQILSRRLDKGNKYFIY